MWFPLKGNRGQEVKTPTGEYSQFCWTAFLFVNTVYVTSFVSFTLNLHSSLCWRNLEGACWAAWSVSLQVTLDWIHEQDLPPKYRWAVSVFPSVRVCIWVLFLLTEEKGECARLSPTLPFVCSVWSVQGSGELFFFSSWDTKKATLPPSPPRYTTPPESLSITPFFLFLSSSFPKYPFRSAILSLSQIPVSMLNNRLLWSYVLRPFPRQYCLTAFIRSGSVCLDVINQTWSPMFGMFCTHRPHNQILVFAGKGGEGIATKLCLQGLLFALSCVFSNPFPLQHTVVLSVFQPSVCFAPSLFVCVPFFL